MDISKEDIKKYLKSKGKENIEFSGPHGDEKGKQTVKYTYKSELINKTIENTTYTKQISKQMLKEHFEVDKLGEIDFRNVETKTIYNILDSIIEKENMKLENFSAFPLGSGGVLYKEGKVLLVTW